MDKRTKGQTDKQTNRQTDKQINRQTDNRTNRQSDNRTIYLKIQKDKTTIATKIQFLLKGHRDKELKCQMEKVIL